jgi:hypothetical protein
MLPQAWRKPWNWHELTKFSLYAGVAVLAGGLWHREWLAIVPGALLFLCGDWRLRAYIRLLEDTLDKEGGSE